MCEVDQDRSADVCTDIMFHLQHRECFPLVSKLPAATQHVRLPLIILYRPLRHQSPQRSFGIVSQLPDFALLFSLLVKSPILPLPIELKDLCS